TWPGRDGACALAWKLAGRLRRPVGWALPPLQDRTFRDYLGSLRPLLQPDNWQEAGRKLLERLPGRTHTARPDGAAPEPAEAVCVADVAEGPVEWLMPGWLPRGAVTVLDGDPDLGKRTLTLDLAARVSQGWKLP